MPIYEYACTACGHQTEIMHKISDPVPKKCPKCGKPRLAKQMSATGFRLGGGGWYETDFKSGNKRNVVDKPETVAATGDAKAEAKPAAESGTKPKAEAKSEPKPKKDSKKPAKAA